MKDLFATTTVPVEYLSHTKALVVVGVLAVLWAWETWLPFFERRERRLRHAGRNLAMALQLGQRVDEAWPLSSRQPQLREQFRDIKRGVLGFRQQC